MSASRSAKHDEAAKDLGDSRPAQVVRDGFPMLPTETEIYILPDGRVVVADLPAELAVLVDNLGETEE